MHVTPAEGPKQRNVQVLRTYVTLIVQASVVALIATSDVEALIKGITIRKEVTPTSLVACLLRTVAAPG